MKLTFTLIALLLLSTAQAKTDNLIVLNIDSIGPEVLNEVKQAEQVVWWLEMGDTLIVSANNSTGAWPKAVSVKTTLADVDTDQLAFHVLGHCDHSENDQLLHDNLNPVFSGDAVRLINTSLIRDKNQLFAHESITPFQKNTVLSYQISNRNFNKSRQKNNDIQSVLNRVNQNRWFSQVEYLAGLDRMLEADLIVAGEWLENHFNALGLSTSRVSLHANYRGFNVLGFQAGTTRADDWYVVGAHLDSRNQNWDDNLPSPGAEDNASGCSGVLEMAHALSKYKTEASIVYMCFIEEESGLLGSRDVVTHFTNTGDISKVKAMLNMDMIGYRGPDRNTAMVGFKNNLYPTLANTLAANGNQYTDIDWQVNGWMCCTDFVSFSDAGIPAVTSNQPDISSYFGYHTVNDLAANVDPSLGAGIIRANLATLIDLVGVDFASGDLIFTDTFEAP